MTAAQDFIIGGTVAVFIATVLAGGFVIAGIIRNLRKPRPRRRLPQRTRDRVLLGIVAVAVLALFPGCLFIPVSLDPLDWVGMVLAVTIVTLGLAVLIAGAVIPPSWGAPARPERLTPTPVIPVPTPDPAAQLTGEDREWFDLWATNAGIAPLPEDPR